MKKVIALALTLVMVLALGVTAFAAGETVTVNLLAEYEVGKTYWVSFDFAGATVTDVVVSDVNGKIKFGAAQKVSGSNDYIVSAEIVEAGVTQIKVTYKDSAKTACTYPDPRLVTLKTAAVVDPDSGIVTDGNTKVYPVGAKIVVDLDGIDPTKPDDTGISADTYNKIAAQHPEKILVLGKNFSIEILRGDYTTLTVKETIKLHANVAVTDRIKDEDKNDMNNRVLAALGNTKADPFYVTVDTDNLSEIASKPVLTVSLDGADFDAWCKVNDCKAMDLYIFDETDDTVALVKKNISVNNLIENWLEMPQFDSATYVLLDAGNSASASANVKPNASTGANDMVAVAVVFATIALAAGVSKKVR